MKSARKSKEQLTGNERFLEKFDKDHFFKYVEGYVLRSLSERGTFEPGKTEWFIVDYFDRYIFEWKTFQYVPEFAEAIFEFLHKHQDKLVSFVTSDSRMKEAMFPEAA